jgi:hypothetical protein
MKKNAIYLIAGIIVVLGGLFAYKLLSPKPSKPAISSSGQYSSANTVRTIWHRLILDKGLDKLEDTVDNLSFREIGELLSEDAINQLNDVPAETLYYGIEKLASISRTDISSTITPANYIKKLIGIALGKSVKAKGDLEEVIFAAEINKDNSPLEPRSIFNWKTAHKIYACFANKGLLKSMHKVGCRWRNNTNGEIELLGAYFISPSSAYNYIYIEKNDEWAIGSYQVELFDVRTLEPIAKDTFEVK